MVIYTLTLHAAIIVDDGQAALLLNGVVVVVVRLCVCVWVCFLYGTASAIRQLEQAIVVTGAQSFRHI